MRLEETAARVAGGRALVPFAAIRRGPGARPVPPALPYTALKTKAPPPAAAAPARPLTLLFAQILAAAAEKPHAMPGAAAAARYAAALRLAEGDLSALRLCA